MSRQLTPVTEINQKLQRRWTAAIQVLECQHLLQTRNGSNYKRLLLTDSEGLKLTALIFSDHLDHYAKVFKQYKRYHISNAFIIPNDPKYTVSSYGYSWVLNNRTLVEECPEHTPMILPCKFEFTEFTKLHRYAESDSLQNVRGIVVQCLSSLEQGVELVTRRDIVIINEEFNNNRGEIQELLSMRNYKKNDFLLPYPTDENIVSIVKATANFESVKTAWISGTLSLPVQERGLSYTACANCQKSLEADTSWIVICPSCRVESEIQDMSRITVTISDVSGFLKANINTPEIEKFIPFSAKDMKIAAENGDDLCEAIASAIESVPIIAFIRAYEIRFHGTTELRVNIVKAYKPTDNPFVDTTPACPSMPIQKGNSSLVPISKSFPSTGHNQASPSMAQKSDAIPTPSTPKKTTSPVPFNQSVPICMKSDVKSHVTPEVNDPRPNEKIK